MGRSGTLISGTLDYLQRPLANTMRAGHRFPMPADSLFALAASVPATARAIPVDRSRRAL